MKQYIGGARENERNFYHPDHLGSGSWITDVSGKPVQHLQYLPYGEPYINQRLSGYNERFTFTGKERDAETGYGYFDARYMDHEMMTMWLSVDPLADKYPGISPYAYCAWTRPTGGDEHRWIKYNIVNNPVKLVDPDGREVYINGEQANRAVAQLQTTNMEISRSEDGRLNVDLHGKNRSELTREERLVYDAIMSPDVKINITAQKTELRGDKHLFRATINGAKGLYECLYGGSNMGSYYNPNNNTAISVGFIDMDMIEANGFDQGVAHEVSEYLIAGQIAIRDRADIEMAIQGKPNPKMQEAHQNAIPEVLPIGSIFQFGIKQGHLGGLKR